MQFDPNTDSIPAQITAQSFIGDILIAFGFATREQVDNALAIQTQERDARTADEKAVNKKTRFTGEILVDEQVCMQEQIDYGLAVQEFLRKPTLRLIDITEVKPRLSVRDFLNLNPTQSQDPDFPVFRLIDLPEVEELSVEDILNLAFGEQEQDKAAPSELKFIPLSESEVLSGFLLRLEGDGILIEVRKVGDDDEEFVIGSSNEQALNELLIILGVDPSIISQVQVEDQTSSEPTETAQS